MSAAAWLDAAFALQRERAAQVDAATLTGLLVARALGSEVELDQLAAAGAEGRFLADLDALDLEPEAPVSGEASITDLAAWVAQANAAMGGGADG